MTELRSTPEGQTEVKRFSSEQREALKKRGYAIYELQGQSIKDHINSGRNFRSKWWLDDSYEYRNELSDFEDVPSMRSEVAVNRKRQFLPRSNNKELYQQEEMVEKYSERLGTSIPGVKAIIGHVPDYAELVFKHKDATGDLLFGEKANNSYTRTLTASVDEFSNMCVGNSDVRSGLDLIDDYDINLREFSDDNKVANKRNDVYVTPLIVPK